MELRFIRALVSASACKECAAHQRNRWPLARGDEPRPKRQNNALGYAPARRFSTRSSGKQEAALASREDRPEEITRKEYHGLVDTYDTTSLKAEAQSAGTGTYLPLAPRLVLTAEQEDRSIQPARKVLPPEDSNHAKLIKRLKKHLSNRAGFSSSKTWLAYQDLPEPRVCYVDDGAMHALLKHLSWTEFKNAESAQRYFAVLEECVAEGVRIRLSEWNSAIAFAGRWARQTTSDEVKNAVEIWMRMENGGRTANNITFNVLFDVAVRAQRFALADTIHEELRARKLPLNRYFRTSMIYYAGLRGNGDRVRAAFHALVNGGEMVDTVVMNCVIASLVRAGEGPGAEDVFEKMNRLHESRFGTSAPRHWVERKELGRQLEAKARELREQREEHESSFFGSAEPVDEHREEAQRQSPIAPDAKTYRILIEYHADITGDMKRIKHLIRLTREGDWRVHGSVYNHVFRGFSLHGAVPWTAWTRQELENLWREFLEGVAEGREMARQEAEGQARADPDEDDGGDEMAPEEDRPPYFVRSMAIRALRAFYTCAGRKRMLEVWEEIQREWQDVSEEDLQRVGDFVRTLKSY